MNLEKIKLNWRKIVLVSGMFLVASVVFLGLVLGVMGSFAFKYVTMGGIKKEWIQEYIRSEKLDILQDEDKTNFLLLGYHKDEKTNGDDITDTIMVISYDHKTGGVKMISVPRDVWSEEMKAKINTAYHYGGLELSKKEVGVIVELPIHYSMSIDFNGFSAVVDAMGGVVVNVPEAFDDYRFPVPGKEEDLCGDAVYIEEKVYECRYKHVHFDEGPNHLSGEKALEYVRSRKAWGNEGTDFARSRRQQQVIEAIAKKAMDKKFLGDPENISSLLSIYQEFTKTDMGKNDYFDLINFGFKNYKSLLNVKIEKVFLDQEVDEEGNPILYNPKYHYSGQWVLLKR